MEGEKRRRGDRLRLSSGNGTASRRLNPQETGRVRNRVTLRRTVENVALDKNGTIFAACGPDVYQGKLAVEAQRR